MVEDELEPLITRCPNCQTQFRVTENQLAIASGRVRCGACLTVFQGTEHLVLDDQAPPYASGSEADAALDELLDELEPGEQLQIEQHAAQAVAAESVHPVARAGDATPFYGGHEDMGQTREVARVDQDASGPDAAEAAAAEPAAAEPTVAPADGLAVEPAPVTVAESTRTPGAPLAEDGREDEDYERWLGRSTTSIDQLVEEVVASGRNAARIQTTPVDAAVPADGAALQAVGAAPFGGADRAEPISFAPEPRRWWAVGVAALFVLLLLVQIAYLQLPEWSKEPALRPAYERVCGWLGCELPEMRALDALRTRNLVVRTHPGTSGALIVDAAIVNTAPFAQRYPDLELRFTSVTGELVAGRRFRPEEYLPADFEGERTMPPDTPIQVSLEIVDPGPDAVNYTLSFR